MCCELAFCKIINSYWSVPASVAPLRAVRPQGTRGQVHLGAAGACPSAALAGSISQSFAGRVWQQLAQVDVLRRQEDAAAAWVNPLSQPIASLARGLECTWRHFLVGCSQGKGSCNELGQARTCSIGWRKAVVWWCGGGWRAWPCSRVTWGQEPAALLRLLPARMT